MVRARSLDNNMLGGYKDYDEMDGDETFEPEMSGILKLAEALPHSQLTSLRSAKTALERCMDFAPSTVTSL